MVWPCHSERSLVIPSEALPFRRSILSFRAKHFVIPNEAFCDSERSEESAFRESDFAKADSSLRSESQNDCLKGQAIPPK